MAEASLLLRMRATGGAGTAAEVAAVRSEIAKLGSATMSSTTRASGSLSNLSKETEKSTGKLRGMLSSLGTAGKAGIAGLAGVFSFEAIKKSVEGVQSLAEGATALHNITGLTTNSAVRLTAVANAMGVSTKQLGVALKTISTQATAAEGGTKSSVKNFAALGITMAQLKGTGGDVQKMLALVTKGLENTKGSSEKTAAAAKLLGRGWVTLNPLLESGGKEMRSLTKFAGQLGITLSGKTGKSLAQARDAAFRFKLVMTAAQLIIVSKVVPALLSMGRWLGKVVAVLGPQLIPVVKLFGSVISAAAGFVNHFKSVLGPVPHILLAVLAPITLLAPAISKIGSAFDAVVGALGRFVDKITGPVKKAVDWLSGAASTIASVLGLSTQVAGTLPNIPQGGATGLPGSGTFGTAPTLPAIGPGFNAPPKAPAAAQGGGGPPVLARHFALAGAAAAPTIVHAHFHWNNREVGKATVYAAQKAKAVS